MCGIVGIYPVSEISSLRVLNDCIRHRGPDDEGYYLDKSSGVAIGIRRLSIIDLEHGHLPISNEGDTVWVVCNGEINERGITLIESAYVTQKDGKPPNKW